MSQEGRFSRRRVLVGAAALGLGVWAGRGWLWGGQATTLGGPIGVVGQPKNLHWRDLRPKAVEAAEAAALLARIEARRRGELGIPEAPLREGGSALATATASGLGGIVSHERAVSSDWVDGGALDTSPGVDAPFSWDTGRPARPEDLVAALHGQFIALPGYSVPLDGDLSGVTSFLLAPYVGACIHVPPPPANQIVLVSSKTPYNFDGLFDAIVVIGEMRVAPTSSRLAEVGYQIRAAFIQPFDPEAYRSG